MSSEVSHILRIETPGDSYILHIDWDRPTSDSPKLPRDVGPFPTRGEAEQFAELNVRSGSWEVWPLSWPYYIREDA